MKRLPKFLKKGWLWIFILLFTLCLFLYLKGIAIEKEAGKRINYLLAFAEILTVLVYGLLSKLLKPIIISKFNKVGSFLFKKSSIPFAIAFILLIVTGVIFSYTKFIFFTKQISNIAYFMLVAAVICEFSDAIKEDR